MSMKERIERIRNSIGDAQLVCVTKGRDCSLINESIDAGVTDIGENRVKEFSEKAASLKPCTRHMIGHLQRNKVKWATELFDMIQSVDRLVLARQIDKRMGEQGGRMPILVQVNIARETQKHGADPDELEELVRLIAAMEHIRVHGLMCMVPFHGDPRPYFRKMRRTFDSMKDTYGMDTLSMGMSGDYQVAVEEGSTMVRIGSAIFNR